MLDRSIRDDPSGALTIPLDQGVVRFATPADDRGDGVAGFDVVVRDRPRLLAAAKRRGLPCADDYVVIGGVRISFV
ncbi:MAG: hypothetical protein HY270_12455 [Deltaproteobacteria bacterium]|nr:hypothetical protein [Deltaproteobacteria bacterium]